MRRTTVIALSLACMVTLACCGESGGPALPTAEPPAPESGSPAAPVPAPSPAGEAALEDRPRIPEDAPEGVDYDFRFSERYDDRIDDDFALTFPAGIDTGLDRNTLSLLERYQTDAPADREEVSDGDGMVPHKYKWYRYSFDSCGSLSVVTDFYEPDGREYISFFQTDLRGAQTNLGIGVGSSEAELLSCYPDSLFYVDREEAEPALTPPGEGIALDPDFDYAYVWQPFTGETNDIRDITFYITGGEITCIELVEPYELRYVYGFDREVGLRRAADRRTELLK